VTVKETKKYIYLEIDLGRVNVASDGSDHHQHVLHDPRRHDLPLHLRHRLHLIHPQHRLRLRHLQRRQVADPIKDFFFTSQFSLLSLRVCYIKSH